MKKGAKKKSLFARFFKNSEKEILSGTKDVQDTIIKTTKKVTNLVEGTSDFLFKDAKNEFEDVGKDFNHLTDNFLKQLMKEEWEIKGVYAKDIMEKASKIKEEDSVKKVTNKLKGKEDILIVIKGKNKIVGMIDEENLLKMLIPEEKVVSQDIVGFMGAGYDKSFLPKKAKDLMKKEIYFVTPSIPLEKIAFIMYKSKFRAVPVVKKNRIIGVVHVRDLLRRV